MTRRAAERDPAGRMLPRSLPHGPLPEQPFVSVILAVRDEERYIARALDGVLRQSYPYDAVEILVVDGESDDGTREVVANLMLRDPRVRLLHNPLRRVAGGLNVGLRAARGDVVVRVDGHCVIPPDYLATCVRTLRGDAVDCAGGPVRAEGETPMARAIARAMSTPFGVGGASFRWADAAGEVDHLPFGAWRRDLFEVIGGFDETLVRNQDDELSDRLHRHGGRILMDPAIQVRYFSRTRLAGLWRQYLGYGFWKVRVIRKRGGRPASLRHVVPAVFVCAALGTLTAAMLTNLWFLPACVLGPYALFLLAATAQSFASLHDRATLLVPCALATMHTAYGVGFLLALARPVEPSRPATRAAGRRAA